MVSKLHTSLHCRGLWVDVHLMLPATAGSMHRTHVEASCFLPGQPSASPFVLIFPNAFRWKATFGDQELNHKMNDDHDLVRLWFTNYSTPCNASLDKLKLLVPCSSQRSVRRSQPAGRDSGVAVGYACTFMHAWESLNWCHTPHYQHMGIPIREIITYVSLWM